MSVPLAQMQQRAIQAAAMYGYRVQRARLHFADFAPLTARDHRGRFIDFSPMHLQWCWHLTYCWNRGLHCGILAHFGSGKTSGFLVPLAAWLLGRNPQARIKVICNGDEAARERVDGIKNILEASAYRDLFPHVRPGRRWTAHAAYIQRQEGAIDPSLQAKGVFSKGIGTRADYLLFDDVVDQENSMNEEQRKKVKERVHMTWMSRLNSQDGRALWIATPWHVDDATHELLSMKGWCFLVQRVNSDCTALEQEVLGAQEDYIPATMAMAQERVQAYEWFRNVL